MEFIDKRAYSNQDEFYEHVKHIKVLNLFDAMKTTHPSLYVKMIKVMRDGEDINYYKDGDLYKVKLPTSELFEKAFGSIILSYNAYPFRRSNLIDIEPGQYFEDCHRTNSITYKGINIPNTAKAKFNVDLAIARSKKVQND